MISSVADRLRSSAIASDCDTALGMLFPVNSFVVNVFVSGRDWFRARWTARSAGIASSEALLRATACFEQDGERDGELDSECDSEWGDSFGLARATGRFGGTASSLTAA